MEPGKKPEGLEAKSKDYVADFDFEPDEKHKTVAITERGVEKAEKFLGIDNMYLAEHGNLVNHLLQALKAESLYKRDVDYAVIDGEVKIIDEFTGRILEGRRWSEGLHQAVEAKEGVAIQEENQTVATITYQNYFRRYDKLAGMTGTALTEATEFMKIYELQVVEIPTNRPMVRKDNNDQIYKTKDGKWAAVVERDRGAPRARASRCWSARSRSRSPSCSREQLDKRGIKHTVLNAKPEHAEREGEIDRRGGPPGAVTIATNMAGRGVDIKLGGNAEHLTQVELAKRGLEPGTDEWDKAWDELFPKIEAAGRGGPREGDGGRRPVHPRHRAPRVAPDRQPAARPLRPPGRPRRVALLPLRRGRPRAPVRRRPHLPASSTTSPRPGRRGRRGGADRAQDALEADRGRPEEGRGAELPDPQARPRVRRRDEPAARDRLRVPRPDPRGRGHVRRSRARRSRDAIERIGGEYMAGDYLEDWDLDGLFTQLEQIYPTSRTSVDDIEPRAPTARRSIEKLREDVVKAYDEREEELGDELMRALERFMLLQIIDERWREHLHDMDYLREGIHLRGFAQIDPLVAYKNEGFEMFTELMNNIWEEFARYIFNVEVEVEPRAAAAGGRRRPELGLGGEQHGRPRNLTCRAARRLPGRDAIAAAAGAAVPAGVSEAGQMAAEVVEAPVPVETRRLDENEKIGRNDPCWCGSGKKFKKCHGA